MGIGNFAAAWSVSLTVLGFEHQDYRCEGRLPNDYFLPLCLLDEDRN